MMTFHEEREALGFEPVDIPLCPKHLQYAVVESCPECGWGPT